jgi:ribonuclease-3
MCAGHKGDHGSSSSSSCSDESSSEDEEDCSMRELERKRLHPDRLHSELWFNDPGEVRNNNYNNIKPNNNTKL